ncbi:MAG: FGGY family carbohydrate kinase, partial [Bdellovibrionaceae bacterium]|nr:FGGY family carbohydrate kinase [Pseudobdellovibrionaceae bacterium]
MATYIMAIDQGTTSTRVVLFDQEGSPVVSHSEGYPQLYPKPGWVEHNPEDIWKSTLKCIHGVLHASEVKGQEIKAIGLTNQRETVMLWDAQSHRCIHNAIVWQCRRTADFCSRLRKRGLSRKIRAKTGLEIDPYFSASKIHWLLKNVPDAKALLRSGNLRAGTVDTFLIWRLTNGQVHATDVSNASRTMLMNLKSCAWDPDLLKIFSVPEGILPEICSSNAFYGTTKGVDGLPDGIPITG